MVGTRSTVDVFPRDLPGLSWNITKAPKFATRTQTAISGRELRVADYPFPRWVWSLQYEFLRDQHDTRYGAALGTGYDELRELMGFYTRQLGSFDTFLYDDPSDDFAQNQGIAIGNGTTTAFQLIRTLSAPSYGGLFTEPITQPALISAVYINNVAIPNASTSGPPNWTLGANGVITFAPAPANGAVISATFSYYWPVHFTEDTAEFENFMYQLHALKKLSFESVILP